MDGRRVVVVGAGITGLSAAPRLAVDPSHLAGPVLEAENKAGGDRRPQAGRRLQHGDGGTGQEPADALHHLVVACGGPGVDDKDL